jgi:crotonobetainyl-CoA:carnitine CoA-transferase CaiB-like acyl-CoA transferase
MMADQKHVLDGYRVLDFTQYLAGPSATRFLAEMGAEVIKVEMAPVGDYARMLPYVDDGRSAYYVQQNRGKKSLCIDLKQPDGLAIIKQLLPRIDVVVENYTPGVIARMGLGYEVISAIKPRIVMCSISTLGQGGPLANRPGYDMIGAAYAGVLDLLGHPDRLPIIPQISIGDITTGVHATAAIGYALLHREKSGKGQYLETSLLDCYFSYHDSGVEMISASHGAMRPFRNGSHHYLICPVGIFQGKSTPMLIIAGTDRQWPLLCAAMGRPELADDPRYNTHMGRVENAEVLKRMVQEWLDDAPNDEAVYQLLEAHRVPYAPVLTVEQAMRHPHLRERQIIRTVKDEFLGEIELPGFPLRFSDFPRHLELQAPTLGQHNYEILGDLLGFPSERIADLEDRSILHSAPR